MNNEDQSFEVCAQCQDPDVCITQCKIKEQNIARDTSLEEYQRLAQDLWFSGGSCTGGKPE